MEKFPKNLKALICDFDGVFTDNRVLVSENGTESVFCHRGDGMGIERVLSKALPVLVISREDNPVVAARCRKMNVPCLHGIKDKKTILRDWLLKQQIDAQDIIYIGNDVNDVECLEMAGCAVVVADAHPDVFLCADIVLKHKGGYGAVRELCDMIYTYLS